MVTYTQDFEKIQHLGELKSFLGREFLTWLWYRSENGGEIQFFSFNDQKTYKASFWIDDYLNLESFDKKGHNNYFKGGNPSKSVEATTSLQNGKIVKKLKMGVFVDEVGEFSVSLNDDSSSIYNLVLPPIDPASTEEIDDLSIVFHRVELTELFMNCFHKIYDEFLMERQPQKKWEEEFLPNLKNWVEKRSFH